MTVGIRPTRPETGYGYIRLGEEYPGCWGGPVFRVDEFTEKPDLERALAFLQTNRYLWNSGMFVWKAGVILAAIERYIPQLAKGLARIAASLKDGNAGKVLEEEFPSLPRISIDYGVMEKADNVLVVPGDFAWDDLGAWTALERVCELDDKGNLARATAVMVDTEGTIIRSEAEDKLVVAVGLKDALIVDTQDVLLVANKHRAPYLKEVLDELKRRGFTRYLTSAMNGSQYSSVPGAKELPGLGAAPPNCRLQEKPWGREVWWSVTGKYVGKVIYVRGGHSLSRQYHRVKQESVFFLSGQGTLELGERELSIWPGLVVDILPGTVHRVRATTDVTFLEVSTPEVDDVVRLQDDYGRAAGIG